MIDTSDMISPTSERDNATPNGDDAGLRASVRAAMLAETLQLGKYSAATQAAVVLALAVMFWDIVPHAYLVGLAASVSALCAAAFLATRRYGGVRAEVEYDSPARGAFLVLRLLAFGRGLAWGTMPAVMLPSLDDA